MSALNPLLDQLTDPAVRDLAWTLGSPTLLDPDHGPWRDELLPDAFFQAALTATTPWLKALNDEPAPLYAFLSARHGHRLGRHFENLIAFWLEHLGVEDLRAGLPVDEAGERRGELDFVFHHAPWGGMQHWEMTVKFYLCHEPRAGLAGFIGPDPDDRLQGKVDRLFGRQLPLAQTEAARALAGSRRLLSRAWVKGWLFFPPEGEIAVPGVSAQAPRGWWVRHGQAPLPAGHPQSRWKVLPRLAWLAPALGWEDERTLFHRDHLERILATHFTRSGTPLMVAELVPDAGGRWREAARGFVVGPRWPEA